MTACELERVTGKQLFDVLTATGSAVERRPHRPPLGRGQLAVLRCLAQIDYLRLFEIALRLGCTQQNVHQIVRRLVTAGLVELVAFSRRSHWRAARITSLGREAIGRSDAEAAAKAEEAFSVLRDDEREMLLVLLDKVRARRAELDDPGADRVVAERAERIVDVDASDVAARTPAPVTGEPVRDEALRARALEKDPSTLPPHELCIWEWEKDGLRAPEQMYIVVELMQATRSREPRTGGGGGNGSEARH